MDYAMQIGQKIKTYRSARGLTVKELAAKAQITASMLSQIERGQATPSLNTIRQLSEALDEPIFRFFMDEVDVQNEVVRRENRKQIIDSGVTYDMLTPDTNGSVEMMPSLPRISKRYWTNKRPPLAAASGGFLLWRSGPWRAQMFFLVELPRISTGIRRSTSSPLTPT